MFNSDPSPKKVEGNDLELLKKILMNTLNIEVVDYKKDNERITYRYKSQEIENGFLVGNDGEIANLLFESNITVDLLIYDTIIEILGKSSNESFDIKNPFNGDDSDNNGNFQVNDNFQFKDEYKISRYKKDSYFLKKRFHVVEEQDGNVIMYPISPGVNIDELSQSPPSSPKTTRLALLPNNTPTSFRSDPSASPQSSASSQIVRNPYTISSPSYYPQMKILYMEILYLY